MGRRFGKSWRNSGMGAVSDGCWEVRGRGLYGAMCRVCLALLFHRGVSARLVPVGIHGILGLSAYRPRRRGLLNRILNLPSPPPLS